MSKLCLFGLLSLAAAVTVVAASVPVASASQRGIALPAPTGRYQVGTVLLHLVDRSRSNPFAPSPPYRELMVSIWYPASHADGYPLAPYMLSGAAGHLGGTGGFGSVLYRVPPSTVDWHTIRTGGHQGAPLARHGAPFPVVLFQPDVQDPRTLETTLVQEPIAPRTPQRPTGGQP